MQITWHGLSSFEIKTQTPNGEVVVVTDPYQNTTGLRFPRTIDAHLLTVSHDEDDANNIGGVAGAPYIINMPGEYEVRDVFVFGLNAPLKREEKGVPVENRIFRIETEGMRIVHLGAIDRELTDVELQKLENIDILMLPVGGGKVLTPKKAAEVIAQIEPRVVIPMMHHLPNMKEKLEGVAAFCNELGSCRKEEMNKYKVTRKDLPEEDMLIVTLSK